MTPRLTTPAAVAAMLVAMMAAPARAADYVQAPGSSLAFATKYDGEVFSGRFGGFDTKLRFDPERLDDARLEVTIQLAGTSTGNADRDSTLAGSDFFNVGRFSRATYVAERFRAVDDGYVADGTLTLRGVSRPVALHFTWTPGNPALLSGRATVKRLEFGVGGGDWADTALIPDEVAISTRVFLHPAP
ncbi:polyisoprenoid-binding protein YceI [Luteimonas sp. J16]|jgi:polyisoprenoid-binding protein YceI|uniref:YceI family protein n=1 Tax=unclassified Luteimonas TaxID=2629088 RepID=UPI00047BD1D0|nr:MULTISPECIES: YceI family protein [unclassified Luteimonas]TWG94441.1 polyisoprenoid-binding protein YceI [Luteimonas sp. J16]